jgi:O-glycosyl hydrolase
LIYNDSAPGICDVQIRLTSITAQTIGGVYYFLTLPASDFATSDVQFVGAAGATAAPLADAIANGQVKSRGVILSGRNKIKVEADFPAPLDVVIQRTRGRAGPGDIQVYFPIVVGNMTAGQVATGNFTLKVLSDVDTAPVTVTLDPLTTGRTWLGIGGNYRIQGPRDPQHIQYILDNMRVAYGRVAMPWNVWQPDENAQPPLLSGNAPATAPSGARGGRGGGGGNMNSISQAMDIAQKLAKQNIPMIISCWQPPAWAVLPNANGRGGGGGGQRLDPAKYEAIAKSIGSYLVYLREQYGAEPVLFSFNESNIGINVRQSPQDHDDAIKILGAEFNSLGLKTKMLLGDTGDAPPINFIQTALNDPDAAPFIGAISFHSWRGATDTQYQAWADAATKLGVPLIDAEGGNDAQASSYPNIFREAWYSLDEAAEYVRIMRICQPEAILEWQLTENYSVLTTGADGNLEPTQRFFNLKQFNLAPAGSAWVKTQSDNALVLPAAFVEPTKGLYTVHMVNNGASRQVTLTGLPAPVTKFNVYITDHTRGMAQVEPLMVTNGSVQFILQGQTLTTLTNAGP